MKTPTPSELKYHVQNTGSNFFDHATMKFFGDTMRNYGTRGPVSITTWTDETPVLCWELYRRHPVKHGIQDSAFFACDTFQRIHPKR